MSEKKPNKKENSVVYVEFSCPKCNSFNEGITKFKSTEEVKKELEKHENKVVCGVCGESIEPINFTTSLLKEMMMTIVEPVKVHLDLDKESVNVIDSVKAELDATNRGEAVDYIISEYEEYKDLKEKLRHITESKKLKETTILDLINKYGA